MSMIKVTVIAASLLFLATTAMAQSNAEQLVFSKTGGFLPLTGNSSDLRGLGGTPFGFWIWCAFHPSPSSTPPTYQFAKVCQGSMYFYFLGVPEHAVSAFLNSEGPEGTYTLTVFGFRSPQQQVPDFTCTLRNEGPPTSGPTNTVDVQCSFSTSLGGGAGTAGFGSGNPPVEGAVVHATGPD
jgi:hypothetical protein